MEKDNQINFSPVVILTRCKIPEYVKIPENVKDGQKVKIAANIKIAENMKIPENLKIPDNVEIPEHVNDGQKGKISEKVKIAQIVEMTEIVSISEHGKITDDLKILQNLKNKDIKIPISCGMNSCKYFENVNKVLTQSKKFVSNIPIGKFLDHVKCHLAKMLQKCQHLTQIQLLQIIHYEIEDSILWRNTIIENGLDSKIPQVCEWNFQNGTECNYQFQNFQDFLAHYYSHCNQVTMPNTLLR